MRSGLGASKKWSRRNQSTPDPSHLEDHPSPAARSMHARYCSSMGEAVGSREGVAVVVVADPRQVSTLLLAPPSLPHMEEGEWWQAGRLASFAFILTLHTVGGLGGSGGGGITAGQYIHTLQGAARYL
jgi:hypothetical protein